MALNPKCQRCAKKIPWVAFAGNAVLATFKVFVGTVSGSRALIADGMHSGSDVLATVMVLISLKIGEQEDIKKHPWGYGKVEFAGALFVYTVLFFISLILFYDAIKVIIEGNTKAPHIFALVAAIVSIMANYILSSYSYCAGKKLSSPALIANANENRADMISSFAVVVGIAGANMGFLVMDSIAAVFVSLFIFHMATTLGFSAYRNLIDLSLPPEKLNLLNKFISQYAQVQGTKYIRTRRVGQGIWIDIELYLDPRLSVKESYMVSREVRLALIRKYDQIKDVSVSFTCKEKVGYKRKLHPKAVNRIDKFLGPLKVFKKQTIENQNVLKNRMAKRVAELRNEYFENRMVSTKRDL